MVPSTPLPVLLPEMVLASQVPWLQSAPVPGPLPGDSEAAPIPSVMGDSCSWGLGDPSHYLYPQGTRAGASTTVSLTEIKRS